MRNMFEMLRLFFLYSAHVDPLRNPQFSEPHRCEIFPDFWSPCLLSSFFFANLMYRLSPNLQTPFPMTTQLCNFGVFLSPLPLFFSCEFLLFLIVRPGSVQPHPAFPSLSATFVVRRRFPKRTVACIFSCHAVLKDLASLPQTVGHFSLTSFFPPPFSKATSRNSDYFSYSYSLSYSFPNLAQSFIMIGPSASPKADPKLTSL